VAQGWALVSWGLLLVPLAGCQPSSSPASSPLFFVDRLPAAEATFTRAELGSIPRDLRLSAAVTLREETRRSLTPAWSAPLSFTVRVPRDPVLQFAIAVGTLADFKQHFSAEFRLSVKSGRGEQIVFRETVGRSERDQWLDREVDLSRWAGEILRLTFHTALVATEPGRVTEPSKLFPLWGNPVLASAGSRAQRPHLILISIDCLRADHVGANGYARATTPWIDRLAKDGVVFETAVSTASYTLPAHMGMLTGLPPAFHGVTKIRKLASSVPYLPELLARSGYEVNGLVAGPFLSQKFGFERGFHLYRLLHRRAATAMVDSAIALFRRLGKGRSQFLFLHLIDPHWRYLPPERFIERFGPRPPDLTGLLNHVLRREEPPQSPEQIQQLKNLYDAEIAYADQELGRFLAELRVLGIYDQSLILLTGDHGEAFFEHEYWQHTETLYDEMIRVPLIVKWPGRSPEGRVKQVISQVDIYPTFLEAASLGQPSFGSSLKGYLEADSTSETSTTAVSEITWESPRDTARKVSLRMEKYKYIATLTGPPGDDLAVDRIFREELYDLTRDPAEKQNLLSQGSRNVESFRRRLRGYLEEARRFRAGGQGGAVVLDERSRERLRSLGYVQ